jgi:drug/metabolite transporter (DMT)-like permease
MPATPLAYAPIAAGLTAALCWGTSDYLSRSQSEKLGYYKTVVYSHIVTLIVLLAAAPVVSPTLVYSSFPILVLVAAGGLNFIAFLFLYRAFHRGVVSAVAPIAYTYPAVTAVLSVALLGAVLYSYQVLAIAGIIAGVILLSTRFSELRSFLGHSSSGSLTAGIGPAMGSSFFFGTVYVGIGYAAPLVSVIIPATVLRAVGAVVGILLAPILHQDVRPSRLAFSKTILAMGILEAVGFLAFTYGISSPEGSLPVVAALSGMGGAVAASYGLFFLRERLEPNQIIGVMLALLGVFALLYLGG